MQKKKKKWKNQSTGRYRPFPQGGLRLKQKKKKTKTNVGLFIFDTYDIFSFLHEPVYKLSKNQRCH